MYNYNETEQKIANKLIKIGFPIKYNGFNYIVTGITLIGKNENNIKISYLYSKIAKVYNSTYSRVERCIRHGIKKYYDNNIRVPEELTSDPFTGILTNKEFLSRLVYMFRDILKDSTDKS